MLIKFLKEKITPMIAWSITLVVVLEGLPMQTFHVHFIKPLDLKYS